MTIFTTGSLITATGAQQLESSFAGASAPAAPVTGQLWYDIPNAVLKVFTGSSWSLVSGSSVTVSESPPATPTAGSLWFNVADNVARMFVWSGTVWVDTNPSGSAVAGIVGVGFNPAGAWSASYSTNTQYTNSTAYMAMVVGSLSPSGNFNSAYVYINGAQVSWDNSGSSGFATQVVGLCPPGGTFQCGGVSVLRVFI